MLTSNRSKVLLTIAFFAIMLNVAYSGPNMPPPKAMEKIETMKKMKLLEILDLKEDDANKFLVKFDALEKQVNEKHKALEETIKNLGQAVHDSNSKDVEKLTDEFLQKKKDLDNAIDNKFSSIRQLLPSDKFAKYIIFERRFQEELRKAVMKRMEKMRDHKPPFGKDKPWDDD